MAARRRLEIAANSVESALAAQAGGADRVELCANLGEGGTTPSHGTIAIARERLRIPLHVLIRARAGDFAYSDPELDAMRRDIQACVRLGCDGVVIGALDAVGGIDMAACQALIEVAAGLDITFHRAFDLVADRASSLDDAVALGCARILTSGGADSAASGAAVIAADRAYANGRIALMAGAGITPANVAAVAAATGAAEVHASAKVFDPGIGADGPAGLARGHLRSDAGLVRALREALDAAP